MDKLPRKSPGKFVGWLEVAADAEREILSAERRIERLRSVVATAKLKAEEGHPFPLDDGYKGG